MAESNTWRPFELHRYVLRRATVRLMDMHYAEEVSQADALAAVAEWMSWVINLDDQFRTKVGRAKYEESRRVNVASMAILGVRHAWNATKHYGHELETIVQVRDGMQWPVQYPLVFREVVWLPQEELPTFGERFRNRKEFPEQERAYRDILGDRAVRLIAPDITSYLCDLAFERHRQ